MDNETLRPKVRNAVSTGAREASDKSIETITRR